MNTPEKPIVFFDGVCALCNGFADFLLQRNLHGKLLLTSLQGETAKELLPEEHSKKLESIIFLDTDGSVFLRSDAVLKILHKLDGGWKIFSFLRVVPKFIRDIIYNIIARNRYYWFGKRKSCRLPSPEEKDIFLP